MKPIILGTAGHIDHGKTSLIRTVTGIDTDRLKEEKLRGITIELGFASMTLPNGMNVGIVDVPGHEKFVKHMVAGATGIDLVAMVIAADEGIMPQTREHMEICTLLDIKCGLVVLTKIDMVDSEWLDMVVDEVISFTEGTFLENAPIIKFSAQTGEGKDEFINAVENIAKSIPDKHPGSIFRLPIDRVFTMKGFGTVITGTLISGKISVGDSVSVYPEELPAKVRGIQVHNNAVETAYAGMRTAINFQGIEKETVNRGDIVSLPQALKPGFMADVFLHYLKSNEKPLKSRTRIRFHYGTSEVLGYVILLDRESLAQGESVHCQLRFQEPVSVVKDDRFVLRSYSPVRTIAGGFVLNPIPKKHKRFRDEVMDGLSVLASGEPESIIIYHAKAASYEGILMKELELVTNMSEKKLKNIVLNLLSRQELIQTDKEKQKMLHGNTISEIENNIIGILKTYHEKNPLKPGMPRGELKSKLPAAMDAKLYNFVMNRMEKDGKIIIEEESVRHKDHRIALEKDQTALKNKITEAFKAGALMPPTVKDLTSSLDIPEKSAREMLEFMTKEGTVVKVKNDLFFDAAAISDLKNKLVDFLKSNGEMSTPQFKDIAEVSRKYLIPLLEFFDSTNVTIRIGEIRKLRRQ